jgi:hypothetical protein
MARNLYTPEEDKFLAENYQSMSKDQMAEQLGRTRKSVEKRMLKVLGLKIDYRTRDTIRKSNNSKMNKSFREEHIGKVPDEWLHLPSSREEADQKNSKYYFTGIPCKQGHIDLRGANHNRCLACNRDKSILVNQRDERREWKRSYRKQDHIREKENAYRKKVIEEDPVFRLRVNVSSRISNFFAGRKSAGKLETTEELLGCTFQEFHLWIESQMQDGMSMENYGILGWHLDHCRPIMSFKEKGIDDNRDVQLIAFNWRNYQPLWGSINLAKNDMWDAEMERSWEKRMRDLGWDEDLFLNYGTSDGSI